MFRSAQAEARRAGDALIDPGSPDRFMYVVRSGTVAIEIGGQTLEEVGPGGMVGEMSLLDEAPRSARVVALTDCEVIPVDQKRFLFMLQETPYFALDVMRTMAGRLRAMNERAQRSA